MKNYISNVVIWSARTLNSPSSGSYIYFSYPFSNQRRSFQRRRKFGGDTNLFTLIMPILTRFDSVITRNYSSPPSSQNSTCWLVQIVVVSGIIELQPLLIQLLRKLGTDINIVLVQPKGVEVPYILAIQALEIDSHALTTSPYFILLSRRESRKGKKKCNPAGWNAFCSELIEHSQVLPWGIRLEELAARGLASTQKVRLDLAAKMILREPSKFELSSPVEVQGGLERLYLWVRAHHFSKPYARADLGKEKTQVLARLGHNQALTRKVGAFQLCIVGRAESQWISFYGMG